MPSVSISTTPTKVVGPKNLNSVILQNLSDTDIFVAARSNVTVAAGSNSGLRIKAGGGVLALNDLMDRPHSADDLQLYAIHSGSGTKELRYEIF